MRVQIYKGVINQNLDGIIHSKTLYIVCDIRGINLSEKVGPWLIFKEVHVALYEEIIILVIFNRASAAYNERSMFQ